MSARLIPLSPRTAPTIPVQRPVVLVGRHPECDLRLDLPKISRRHCCFALAYDRLVVRDLGSRNGLRVNGLLTEEAQLRHGDEVAIGPLIYRVDMPVEQPRPARPAAPVPSALPAPTNPRPPSLPFLPQAPADPDSDLVPLDIDF